MKGQLLTIDRRNLFCLVVAGTVAAATGTAVPEVLAAEPESRAETEKRKARFQANSPEVQDFYRVNRYPGGR
jgi:hypothetical protein